MVTRKRKKSRHARGENSTRGSGKRNRGAGNRGGRGKAGAGKRAGHRKLMFYLKGKRYGVQGFTSVKQKKKFKPRTVNLSYLDKKIDKLVENKLAQKTDKGIEINLGKMGYDKLLGSGKINNKLIIKVNSATESAKKKVEKAGGELLLG